MTKYVAVMFRPEGHHLGNTAFLGGTAESASMIAEQLAKVAADFDLLQEGVDVHVIELEEMQPFKVKLTTNSELVTQGPMR